MIVQSMKILIALQLISSALGISEKEMLDVSTVWTITPPQDIRMIGKNQASCLQTMMAHANRLLSEVDDANAIIQHLITDESSQGIFQYLQREAERLLLRTGCPEKAIWARVQTRLPLTKKVYCNVYMDVTLDDNIPIDTFSGEIDSACVIRLRKDLARINVQNVDLLRQPRLPLDEEPQVTSLDWQNGEGVDSVIMEADETETVQLFLEVICKGKDKVTPLTTEIKGAVTIKEIRDLFGKLHANFGTQSRGTFMTVAFHPHGFFKKK